MMMMMIIIIINLIIKTIIESLDLQKVDEAITLRS
jgi:hypothetical protein